MAATPARDAGLGQGKAAVPTARDYALLLSLGAIWGGSFFLIKLAVATVPPLSVATGRIVVGTVLMGALLALQGRALPEPPRKAASRKRAGACVKMVPGSSRAS